MDRRAFLGALAGSLVAAPLAAKAEEGAGVRRVGLLRPGGPTDPAARAFVGAFLTGLREAGYVQPNDVRVEIRYAHGKFDRLPALARELAALQVDAMVTSNPYTTRAAREASSSVPIVVALDYETDPVASGWITSIARPGGNLTGFFLDQPEVSRKLLQLLKESVPGLSKVAALWDETIDHAQRDATEGAARAAGLSLNLFGLGSSEDLTGAFRAAARERANGLVVLTSPLVSLNRARIAQLALTHRLPGITLFSNFPVFGLLMAYGPNQPTPFIRQVATWPESSRAPDRPTSRFNGRRSSSWSSTSRPPKRSA